MQHAFEAEDMPADTDEWGNRTEWHDAIEQGEREYRVLQQVSTAV